MTKPTKWQMRPAKTQISLGIRPVWSESLLCAQWVTKDQSFLQEDREDSDQSISVFTGHIYHFVGFVIRWLICKGTGYSIFAAMSYKGVINSDYLFALLH